MFRLALFWLALVGLLAAGFVFRLSSHRPFSGPDCPGSAFIQPTPAGDRTGSYRSSCFLRRNNLTPWVSIFSNLPDTRISLDQSPPVSLPASWSRLEERVYQLTFYQEGYSDLSLALPVDAGWHQKIEVEWVLQPTPTPLETLSLTGLTPTPLPEKRVLILSTPTGYLNVRSAPSRQAELVGTVYPGEQYSLISQEGDWFKILLRGNTTGYIYAGYARELK